jgi:thiol-disulfide isomerase/thioredoxin
MKKFLLMLAVASAGFSMSSRAQLSQNFESTSGIALPTGWTQSAPATSTGWHTGTNTTFTVGYWSGLSVGGTIAAHTRFVGVVDQSASSVNPADTLKSASFSLAGITNAYLSFDGLYGKLRLQTGPFESALIMVSNNNGAWVIIDSVMGSYTNADNHIYWTKQHVSMSAYNGATNLRVAFTYTDRGGYIAGVCLDNITVSAPAAVDIQLVNVSPIDNDPKTAFAKTSSTLPLTGNVVNNGTTAITSFNVTYQIGANAPVTLPVTGVNIPLFGTYSFNAGNITMPATAGNYNMKVWATVAGDANHTNDSAVSAIGAYDSKPTKKLVIEEATGTWCGWCVRGIVYMDSLQELYGEGVSLVAVHNNDPMTVAAYDAFVSGQVGSSYPNALIDRREVTDPGNLLDVYNAENGIFGFADVVIGKRTLSGNSVSVPVTITPFLPLSGDYRLVIAVTEDKIHMPAGGGSTWLQHNYYSRYSQNVALTGQSINYQDSNATLNNVYFAHVARSISPSVTGTANLPATMAVGTAYPVTLTTTLNAAWNTPFIKVVVMLVRGSDGYVLNSNNTTLWNTSVANVTASITKAMIYPNPAATLTNIALDLSKNSTVQVKVTDMLGRQVYATPAEQYVAGTHNITISTAAFASGNYNVSICTENGIVTQKLTVIK